MKLKDVLIDEIYNINQKNIETLRENMNGSESQKTSWALCLGAGVSISCGLPDWSKLLAMINGKILQSYSLQRVKENRLLHIIAETIGNIEKNDDFTNKMNEAAKGDAVSIYGKIDLLELAEYIRTQIAEMFLPDEKVDEEKIDNVLRILIRESYGIDKTISGFHNSTLGAVVTLMEKKEIRRAITYNYDDLLEIALKQRGKNVVTILPGDRQEFTDYDQTYRVYHCHGLIPVDPKNDPSDPKSRKIILTESSYYDEEFYIYSLANVLQAYSMSYCNLLYIGFSGMDYTFRRIIRGLGRKEKEIKHSIFFSVDDVFNMVYEGGQEKDKNIKKEDYIKEIKDGKREYEKLMINQILVSKTLYWKEKGMNVIWSTHEELATILKSL